MLVESNTLLCQATDSTISYHFEQNLFIQQLLIQVMNHSKVYRGIRKMLFSMRVVSRIKSFTI